ncbi:hypothetical protein LJR034_001496 [Caballeronia sp. LjRoot34]|uniref:hypothetical protein n=1 Tax=Caballeronia sp. LjRoot34 TaxID=3342325 RepID=UPI003ED13A55
MAHYAIIEQANIRRDGAQSKIFGIDAAGHECLYKQIYRSGKAFDQCIAEACAALSRIPENSPKVLVISAHGHELSGDLEIPGRKVDGDEQSISLWLHSEVFRSLPKHTVVHLSTCFGAYPNAMAIQKSAHYAPPIIGPLVDITFDDALALHSALLDHLDARGIGDAELCEFVEQMQGKFSICQTYRGRFVIGLIDRYGNQHPKEAVGAQLAAKVEDSRISFSAGCVMGLRSASRLHAR